MINFFVPLTRTDFKNYDDIQFLLVYLAHYSHGDLECLTYRELDDLWDQFRAQRKLEKEAADAAQKR